MVYEEEPYLHTYLSRLLQAIQLFRPARGVTKATQRILEHVEHWYQATSAYAHPGHLPMTSKEWQYTAAIPLSDRRC